MKIILNYISQELFRCYKLFILCLLLNNVYPMLYILCMLHRTSGSLCRLNEFKRKLFTLKVSKKLCPYALLLSSRGTYGTLGTSQPLFQIFCRFFEIHLLPAHFLDILFIIFFIIFFHNFFQIFYDFLTFYIPYTWYIF